MMDILASDVPGHDIISFATITLHVALHQRRRRSNRKLLYILHTGAVIDVCPAFSNSGYFQFKCVGLRGGSISV